MYMKNYPEDSVLRRHFESAAALKRQAWLQRPPSDSVLRRHYEQWKTPQRRPRANQPASRSETRPNVASAPAEQPGKGGFFAWLRGLFGG